MNWEMLSVVMAVLVMAGGGVAAFSTVKQKLDSHEELDNVRFVALTEGMKENREMLSEVRGDVKQILKNGSGYANK